MENNYPNKDTKPPQDIKEYGFNEYNLMSFNSSSSYQEYLKTLKEDKSKLLRSISHKYNESYF
jgi:hypothetical protein